MGKNNKSQNEKIQRNKMKKPRKQIKIKKYPCPKCNQKFPFPCDLKKHEIVHSENAKKIPCPLCSYSSDKMQLIHHYTTGHDLDMQPETIHFESEKDFYLWKGNFEVETKSNYVKETLSKKKDGSTTIVFKCHRDGFRKRRSKNINKMYYKPTKIDTHCPAKMQVVINSSGKYLVRLVKTHVGHGFELYHLNLRFREKLTPGVDLIVDIPKLVDNKDFTNTNIENSTSDLNRLNECKESTEPIERILRDVKEKPKIIIENIQVIKKNPAAVVEEICKETEEVSVYSDNDDCFDIKTESSDNLEEEDSKLIGDGDIFSLNRDVEQFVANQLAQQCETKGECLTNFVKEIEKFKRISFFKYSDEQKVTMYKLLKILNDMSPDRA